MKNPAIFCDFDGTITDNDNIIAIMKQFDPPGWEQLKDDVLSQQISIREGVGKMFSLLPSRMKNEVTEFAVKQASIRKGFKEFVEFTKQEGVPLYIVSGGIDFFVEPILEKFGPFTGQYCNSADFSEKFIRIDWPHPCDDQCTNDCGCCKTSVIRKLDGDGLFKIVIGDSITDLEAAKQADFILARDLLAEKCADLKLNYQSFETFDDCKDQLKRLLEVRV